ncbi:MAG: aminoacyl-tRNA deacylase [Sphingomonadales bacterium]
MAIALSLQHYLDNRHIPYEVVVHRATASSTDTAQSAHVASDSVAKGVLLEDEAGFVLAVIPASSRVNLRNIRFQLDRRLGLSTEDKIATVFPDCSIGAIPPIGQPYQVEMIMDSALEGKNDIFFEGGDHCSLVHVDGNDFRRLMAGAEQGAFAQPRT